MRRSLAIAAVVATLAAVAPTAPPAAVADEAGATSHLNPWSIDGALFARGAAGVAGVDIPGACLAAYQEWEELHLEEHNQAIDTFRRRYQERVAANQAAIAAGEEPPHSDVPPVRNISEDQYVAEWLPYPVDPWEYLDELWQPMEYVPGTSIPCFGVGVLPAPPGGFLGINLGEEPPDPDPCTSKGHLPFSPAVWEFVPWWHERAPLNGSDIAYSGIRKAYDLGAAEAIFVWIPIVIGVELPIECLAIFPDAEATQHFTEQLPAAELTILPEGIGLTGADTKLWYDFSDPSDAVIGPITVGLDHRGTSWTLTAYAWVDEVGWNLDATDDPAWDVSVDFPDTDWVPAYPGEYETLAGSLDFPAHLHTYERKDFYTIATGVTWRGYYVVDSIGGLGWGFTEQYEPVTRWTTNPYQVDEIVGRRN